MSDLFEYEAIPYVPRSRNVVVDGQETAVGYATVDAQTRAVELLAALSEARAERRAQLAAIMAASRGWAQVDYEISTAFAYYPDPVDNLYQYAQLMANQLIHIEETLRMLVPGQYAALENLGLGQPVVITTPHGHLPLIVSEGATVTTGP